MSRLPAILQTVVDAAGAPAPLAKLYTYVAGSSTAKATYPTAADLAALTNAHANPVVAGADGVLPAVFCIAGEPYKFLIKDADDVTLHTYDNVYSEMLTSDDLIVRVKQIASNPIDYGAEGDGVADESEEVQAAIDGATANGVVDLLGLTFRCDSVILLREGITLRNGTIDSSNCTADEFIRAVGSPGSAKTLTANGDFNDGAISLDSVSGLAASDLLFVTSSANYTASGVRGELVEIESIASLDVSLQGALLDDYTTATSASATEITTVDDITLDGLTLIGAENISGTHDIVALCGTRRARIVNCNVRGIDSYGITISACFDTLIEGCTITDGATSGILITDASRSTKVVNCVFSGLDTAIIVAGGSAFNGDCGAGPPRFTDIRGCTFDYGGTASSPQINVSAQAQHVRIVGNTISMFSTAAGDAINANCVDVEVSGNEIYRDGTGTPVAIELSTTVPNRTGRAFAVRANGNKVRTDGSGIVHAGQDLTGGSGTLDLLEIKDNFVSAAVTDVSVAVGSAATSPPIGTLLISGNISGKAIAVTAAHASATLSVARILNNQCEAVSVDGTTTNITSLFFQGNTIFGASTAKMVDIDNVVTAECSGNRLAGDATDNTHGFELTACTHAVLRNNYVNNVTTRAALVDESTTIVIEGGVYDCAAEAIEIDNTTQEFTRCRISGVTIYGGAVTTTGEAALEIDASDATRSTNLNISGCHIEMANADADTYVVAITGLIDRLTMSGNTCVRGADDDAANILIDGDAAGGITAGMITGNTISGGSVGISAADITSVYAGPNNFDSVTATMSGVSNALTWTRAAAVVENRDLLANASATSADDNAAIAALLQDLENLGFIITT